MIAQQMKGVVTLILQVEDLSQNKCESQLVSLETVMKRAGFVACLLIYQTFPKAFNLRKPSVLFNYTKIQYTHLW